MRDIISLPYSVPATGNATRRQMIYGRLQEFVGSLAKYLRVPGAIKPVEIHDEVSGQHLRVEVSQLFTKISVNGRDYYFRRLSGRFDGTGSRCN